jgi:predicted dehydrogenase
MNRRDFMKQAALSGAALSAAPHVGAAATQTPPSDRVAVGLIGAGARGQELLEAALQVPGVEIVALSDAYRGRTERAKLRTGGRAAIHGDYHEILTRPDVDAVIVATPDHWHSRIAIDALEAGKGVYVEKPMTYTVDQGLQMMAAVQRTGRTLQVGSQGISSATDIKAREIVASGSLGKITMVRASYNRNTAGGAWIYPIPPDASPSTVDWDRFLGPAPKRPFSLERFFRWRCYWDYSGGIAGDLFVHLLTSIHFVMNATMPGKVMASGELYRWKESREVPDTLNAILTYPEGFTVNLSSTFNNQSSSESGFEILGTEGSLAFRGGRLVVTPEEVQEDNRWVVDSWPVALEEAYYNDPKVQAEESPGTWAPKMLEGGTTWNEVGRDSTVVHMTNFVEAVRQKRQANEPAAIGHHAAAAAHMVNMAVRQGRTMEWDFKADTVKTT